VRRLIVCADDFGLDPAVNEAVEAASHDGILTCASLMVGAPAAEDAVARAHRLPHLRVGLHLALVEARPVLPPEKVARLVDAHGAFDDNMVRAGLRFFFNPMARRQLAAEIRAQFEAFRATGLRLDHVNAHKHFHLHPTVAGLIIAIGRDYGMRAVRVPLECRTALRQAAAAEGARLAWSLETPFALLLRHRLRRAGLLANDHLLGLAWSGGMTEERMLRLLAALPAGITELYCHPAAMKIPALARIVPDYRPTEELAALRSPAVRRLVERSQIALIGYGDLDSPRLGA
jgi:hopanoid biosynthesis associated protein HpnK